MLSVVLICPSRYTSFLFHSSLLHVVCCSLDVTLIIQLRLSSIANGPLTSFRDSNFIEMSRNVILLNKELSQSSLNSLLF